MKKILIIEDDQIVANIYRNKLIHEGYEVETALDGEAGFEMVRTFRPDVVVLDLMLPKISGIDLIKKIRAEEGFDKTPLVVFSNTYLTNLVQEAWKAGATKCLSKANCTPRQLIDVIRNAADGPGSSGAPTASAQPAKSSAPAAPQPVRPPQPQPATSQSDAEFQAGLHKSFIHGLPATLAELRTSIKPIVKADNEAARVKEIGELCRRIHTLAGSAGVSGMAQIALVCDALEALLKELGEKPQNINASTLRTLASTIDFLGFLFDRAARTMDKQEIPPARVLVVDDEAISRRAIVLALEKAKLKSTDVEDPHKAFKLITEGKYDLVFLDVDMPGMNGFELCTKLRALPAYKTTPVIFVTSLTDFESRASSMMSGGNDFIAKPFLLMELAVKALVYVLRSKLAPANK
jgi:DNA-binding response OmpR family regulator